MILNLWTFCCSLDIVCTVSTDTDIETQRADASLKATAMLIRGLIFNRDISPQVYDAADKNMKQRRLLLDGNLDTEFQRQNKKLRKKLAAKNKVNIKFTVQNIIYYFKWYSIIILYMCIGNYSTFLKLLSDVNNILVF